MPRTVSQTSTRSSFQKRTREISPTEKDQYEKANKKKKDMATKADILEIINSIKEFRSHYDTTTNEMRAEQKLISENIAAITTELTSARNDIKVLTERVNNIEHDKLQDHSAALETSTAQINALEQKAIDTQLSISNIPSSYDIDSTLTALANWSNVNLNENTLSYHNLVTSKNNTNTSILFLDFTNVNIKTRFLKHIKTQQKDQQKKYTPILTEQIFQIAEDDTSRGLEINFREQYTEVNKKIFDLARKNKTIVKAIWKSQGYINIKVEPEMRAIRILTLEQLKKIINEKAQLNN